MNSGSWSIGNKTVQSLHIGQKEIQSIERVSDGAIIYQRTPTYELTVTSDKATALVSERITFIATLTLDNQAVSGEIVTFTDGTNTIGTATTDSNGVVTLTYSWNNEDNYSIKAIYNDIESNNVNIEIILPTDLTLIFNGNKFTTINSSSYRNYGLIGSNMVINWGDGQTQSITSNTRLPDHTYSTNGTYIIQIKNVTAFGDRCFQQGHGIENVIIPQNITTFGNFSFNNCTELIDIIIPTNIIASSFPTCFLQFCSSLKNVVIPQSITSLGQRCFDNSGLTNITIPSSVTSIGQYCFNNCNNLIDYQLYWQDPPITWSNNLMKNNTNTYFTIPNGTTANYVAKSFPSAKLIERSA